MYKKVNTMFLLAQGEMVEETAEMMDNTSEDDFEVEDEEEEPESVEREEELVAMEEEERADETFEAPNGLDEPVSRMDQRRDEQDLTEPGAIQESLIREPAPMETGSQIGRCGLLSN